MQQLWLVTVPNNKESPDTTLHLLQTHVVGSSDQCRIHKFVIPPLVRRLAPPHPSIVTSIIIQVVGTLDSLIALSDDLNKINSQVEASLIASHRNSLICLIRMSFAKLKDNISIYLPVTLMQTL